ncbi:small subunit of acetolactate synthase-domain-containing protein [Pavlovales sp. CCMP2436]|nr:small subunit of acetolactate synthase-domain-containing protein [Pavlovales sp. CCMP2436]
MSRMTIQSSGTQGKLDQLRRQMEAMVQVREVVELASETSALIDLALIKVSTKHSWVRSEVVELANLFRAAVVDVSAEELLIKLADHPSKVDSFISLMDKFEIVEMGRTGVVAVSNCGAAGTISKPKVLPTQHSSNSKMSEADLPPS